MEPHGVFRGLWNPASMTKILHGDKKEMDLWFWTMGVDLTKEIIRVISINPLESLFGAPSFGADSQLPSLTTPIWLSKHNELP